MANSFLGSVDEVAVYSSALSASRIRQHYQTGIAIPGRYADEIIADSPVGYWRLRDSKGQIAKDSSGNNRNGTYTATNVIYNVNGALRLSAVTDEDGYNTIALYFRELPLDEQTQLDLDGMTQAKLDALNAQPDYGNAKYSNRTQGDLDAETQTTLDGDTQFDLERVPDYTSEAWLEVKLTWRKPLTIGGVINQNDQGVLTIKTANGYGYTFNDIVLSYANAEDGGYDYSMIVDLEGSSIRVRIYRTDIVGNYKGQLSSSPLVYGPFGLVYDTGLITDDQLANRRKGRFGWWAKFSDGDAAIKGITTRGLTYASVKTQEFKSNTPVEGASLYSGGTPPTELFRYAVASPWGGTVNATPNKTVSRKAYEIVGQQGLPLQGIQTNEFILDDLAETTIAFDVNFPGQRAEVPGQGISAFLYGQNGQVVPLRLPQLKYDSWLAVRIPLKDLLIQAGRYRLIVIQDLPARETTWYLDNVSILTNAVIWEGRGGYADPWGISGNRWIPFDASLNKSEGGVLFDRTGDSLQVRADARRQDARIDGFEIVPKYAELGRIQFSDQIENLGVYTNPSANFTSSVSGRTVTFTSTSTPGTYPIVNYTWNFGDGTKESGAKVRKTFESAGTYEVQLIATDSKNNKALYTDVVSV